MGQVRGSFQLYRDDGGGACLWQAARIHRELRRLPDAADRRPGAMGHEPAICPRHQFAGDHVCPGFERRADRLSRLAGRREIPGGGGLRESCHLPAGAGPAGGRDRGLLSEPEPVARRCRGRRRHAGAHAAVAGTPARLRLHQRGGVRHGPEP